MDVNGTRFHMLLGEDDWSRCMSADGRVPLLSPPGTASPPSGDESSPLYWDSDRDELILHPYPFEFASSPFDSRPAVANRRGAGCDRFGNWYWIDESEQKILVNSAGSQVTSLFWTASGINNCPSRMDEVGFIPVMESNSAPALKLKGLAVTEDHYLVAGTVKPAGLLIFDLYGGGAPQRSEWPEPLAPFDMAARPGGGVLILDRVNRLFWALNRDLNVCNVEMLKPGSDEQEDFFQPQGGISRRLKPKETFHRGISLREGSPALDIDPIAIEALPDGSVLILDRAGSEIFSRIRRFSMTGEKIGQVDLKGGTGANSYTVIGHDIAFMPEQSVTNGPVKGRLYIADKDGNQSLAFALMYDDAAFKINECNDYLPMRLFGGKGLVRSGTQVFYDFSNTWLPLIRQNRPRYQEDATFITPVFDGREPDCVWHRFLLDAAIPPETGVAIWSLAANQQDELHSLAWKEEPVPYRRGNGSELAFVQTPDGIDTWESLFQAARGRYLQMKIKLFGNGRATPRLRALRAYYPRFSYLDHYLPAVYREDGEAASFLDRFLANLEGMYTAIEDRIAAAQILFDPQNAPPEALEWLAGWFDISLDPSWDECRQRLFIGHAMDFFNCRGTIRGLQMALRLALDECVDETLFTDTSKKSVQQSPIRIVERFRTRRTPGVILGDPSDAEFGPGIVTPAGRWTPEQTREELCRRYSAFIASRATKPLMPKEFSITRPLKADEAALWQQFSQETVGFVPSASTRELQLWQDFLARRYRTIAEFNRQNESSCSSFNEIPLPSILPADGAALLDWYQFESVVLPMRRNAHQFTVLLPTPKSGTADTAEYQRRLQLARRIVELEKPAHTTYSVNFYWAMFRVGEARVGYDTVVDQGSRAPEFMAAMVLGKQHIGESFIGALMPQLQDRYTLGETELN